MRLSTDIDWHRVRLHAEELILHSSKYKIMIFLNENIRAVKGLKKVNLTGYTYAIKADRILFTDK